MDNAFDPHIKVPEFAFRNVRREFEAMFKPKEMTRIEMAALSAYRGDLAQAERIRRKAGYDKVSDNDKGGQFAYDLR